MSSGSLSQYFPDKDALLYALGEPHNRDLSQTMAAVMTICWSECACRRVTQGPDGLREGEDLRVDEAAHRGAGRAARSGGTRRTAGAR